MADRRFSITDLIDGGMAAATGLSPARAELSLAEPVAVEAVRGAIGRADRGALSEAEFSRLVGLLPSLGNPQAVAEWFIAAKYKQLGAESGLLGQAQTPVTVCPDGQGYFRHFAGGSIYYHPVTGAHEVHGDIRARWSALGWERSFLGYPASDEADTADRAGRVSRFQRGAIYWQAGQGTREVHGAIYRKYRELGAESGLLGRPSTDETGAPDGVGRFNHFAGGSIYWKPSISAHEVHGLIRQAWAAAGWERNPALGYPISDELAPQPPAQGPRVIERPEVIGRPEVLHPEVIGRPEVLHPEAPRSQPARPELTPARPEITPARPEITPARPGVPSIPEPSKNRFSDFENGVLHWASGAAEAHAVAPSRAVVDGAPLSRSAADVLAAARPLLTGALGRIPNAALKTGPSYAGVTDYSFDGVVVHNRRHRVTAELRVGPETPVVLGVDMNSYMTLELLLEVGWDPLRRDVLGFLTGWSLKATRGPVGALGALGLHGALDPVLWAPQRLWHVPERSGDATLTVLSVKVLPSGEVDVFTEPAAAIVRPLHPVDVPVRPVDVTPVHPVIPRRPQ